MLANKYRFHGYGSLNYLFRRGTVSRGRLLLVRYVENKRREDSRATVIVGKKVAKSAVVRNRIRRRIYEVLRRHWDHIPTQADFAVTALSAELAVLPSPELERAVISLLRRANLYQLGD